MIKNLDKSLFSSVSNSNEFKGWLLSRRWFGDKSALQDLDFNVSIIYFEVISEKIFLTVIEVKTKNYTKEYFLPLVFYKKIQDILEKSEKQTENVVRLTENTFSKKLVLTDEDEKQKILTLNLLEAEHCLLFWRKMLLDKDIAEMFPSKQIDLTLFTEQFQDDVNLKKVQNLIEASMHPERYELILKQLGKGNTTNILFQLDLVSTKGGEQEPISYILKSYKNFSESLEPSALFVLLKNNYPNAPKIYGTLRICEMDSIGILENVPNVGNLGEIYWNELNDMINNIYEDWMGDLSRFTEKSELSRLIKENCANTIKVSTEIGNFINELHKNLTMADDKQLSVDTVDTNTYLKNYSEKLETMVSELQYAMSQKTESGVFQLPKIGAILDGTKTIIEKFRSEFKDPSIKIQPVHQDLHMEQVLYNKDNGNYNFFFIDFEGDPQLTMNQKKAKFPAEKDLASFLRALSYIKFNTILNFIDRNIIRKYEFEVPEAILFNLMFGKVKPAHKVLEDVLQIINAWEYKLMGKILKNLSMNKTLISYFYIERTLHELSYELLFRPNKIIIPILGLKEVIDRS